MHQEYVLFTSHYGFDELNIRKFLNQNPEISVAPEALSYKHPFDIYRLKQSCNNIKLSRYCFDLLSLNQQLQSKLYYNLCKIVLYYDEPVSSINRIMSLSKSDSKTALDCYAFRLQRMAEIAVETKDRCIITWSDNLGESLSQFIHIPTFKQGYKHESHFDTLNDRVKMHSYQLYEKYFPRLR